MKYVRLVAWLVAVVGCGEVPAVQKDAGGDGGGGILDDGGVDAIPVDAPPQFSSCNGLAATCGAASNDNCCAASTVAGGSFFRGYDVATDGMHTNQTFSATISSFVLDKYEVTVGRFRKFVEAGFGTQMKSPAVGSGAHPNLASSGWRQIFDTDLRPETSQLIAAVKCAPSGNQHWTDTAGANENKPMNCLSWYEAMAFCIWDGGYLPTEAEWNYAAAGGNEQRAFPWSNPASSLTIDCTYANYFINNPAGTYCGGGTFGSMSRVGATSPKGDGKYGQTDLAGNVSEWFLDYYAATYPAPCTDCANLAMSNTRVHSGSYVQDVTRVRTAYRGPHDPLTRFDSIGVRCARPVP